MVKKEEFYYDSRDKKTKIHGIKWIPVNQEIRIILQIVHGMLEHIDRYDDFANYLAENGILVVGNDHLGHGSSLAKEEDRGFFSEKDGNKVVMEDIFTLMNIIKSEYSNVPYFMLGHSMGSFLLRQYITIYEKTIDGAIIVGTGFQPYILVKSGEIITRLIAVFKGWGYRSKFVNNLAIGGNNKKFEPGNTDVDWLSRDEKIVDGYINDKRIDFIFTLNAYYNMFKGMLSLYDNSNLSKIDKNLPIILLSGEDDPVGNFGKDVIKAYNGYKNIGMRDVSYKLYKNYRHEIINELDRKVVYEDILNWIEERI
jgi:alpha-beta hydrolase superfamily lysophospholipase